MTTLLLGFAALLAPVCIADDASDGATDARAAIASGDLHVMRKGKFGDGAGGYDGLDAVTGLPAYSNGLGCIVFDGADHDDRQYVAEFNAVMLAYLKENGLPANHRKKWVSELSHPIRSFKVRTLIARKPTSPQPVWVKLDGPPATSPDGRYTLQYEIVKVRYGEREVPEKRLIVMTAGRQVASRSFSPDGDTELFWAPEGSDAAYLRWTEKKGDEINECHASLDLRVGEWIELEKTIPPRQ